jgi:periplasmic protein TonB
MQNSGSALRAPTRRSARLTAGIGFVVAIHIAAIWALVNGLVPGIMEHVPGSTTVDFIPPAQPPLHPLPPPNPDKFVKPQSETAIEPQFQIGGDPGPTAIHLPTGPSAGDTLAAGIASTHTTPPYPALAQRMGEEGTVRLSLSISAQGMVTAADVVKSSGSPELDAAAAAWVKANWRYRPAVQGGVAVASSTQALVTFNLKTAR